MNTLQTEDNNIFKKLFPEKSQDEINKYEDKILILLKQTESLTKNIINKGFKEDFSDINYKEWFSYIMKLIPFIDNFKDLKGRQKLDFLLVFCVYIIMLYFPINNKDLKEKIIDIVIDMIPDIVDTAIDLTKILHTGIKYVIKSTIKCCKKKN